MRLNLLSFPAAACFLTGFAAAQVPGVNQVAPVPAQTGAVFIAKDDFPKALLAVPGGAGIGLASLAAVRAGDDRISVDELKRIDVAAEGPVSHTNVTEVYYILVGGGVMETGGTITDAVPMLTKGQPTNPASIGPSMRGTKMVGGTPHHVTVGDVVIVPPGVPHRFVSLDGLVTYLVVRVNPGYEHKK